jgi:hypothetical protein
MALGLLPAETSNVFHGAFVPLRTVAFNPNKSFGKHDVTMIRTPGWKRYLWSTILVGIHGCATANRLLGFSSGSTCDVWHGNFSESMLLAAGDELSPSASTYPVKSCFMLC